MEEAAEKRLAAGAGGDAPSEVPYVGGDAIQCQSVEHPTPAGGAFLTDKVRKAIRHAVREARAVEDYLREQKRTELTDDEVKQREAMPRPIITDGVMHLRYRGSPRLVRHA